MKNKKQRSPEPPPPLMNRGEFLDLLDIDLEMQGFHPYLIISQPEGMQRAMFALNDIPSIEYAYQVVNNIMARMPVKGILFVAFDFPPGFDLEVDFIGAFFLDGNCKRWEGQLVPYNRLTGAKLPPLASGVAHQILVSQINSACPTVW